MICGAMQVSVLVESTAEGQPAAYLEVAEPDFVVEEREGEDMVDERFRFACLRGHTEYLQSHATDPAQNRKPSATTAHLATRKQ